MLHLHHINEKMDFWDTKSCSPCLNSAEQGFINVFFFLFLDEINNRVKVTKCQSPISPTQFFDLRKQRQLSDRPPDHGGPNFPFLELVTFIRRDAPQVRKTSQPLSGRKIVSDSVCFLPCYPLFKVCVYCYFHLRHFIVSLIIIFLLATRFFFCSKIESRTSNRVFFPRS